MKKKLYTLDAMIDGDWGVIDNQWAISKGLPEIEGQAHMGHRANRVVRC